MNKRIIASILTVIMLMTMLPTAAFAYSSPYLHILCQSFFHQKAADESAGTGY